MNMSLTQMLRMHACIEHDGLCKQYTRVTSFPLSLCEADTNLGGRRFIALNSKDVPKL